MKPKLPEVKRIIRIIMLLLINELITCQLCAEEMQPSQPLRIRVSSLLGAVSQAIMGLPGANVVREILGNKPIIESLLTGENDVVIMSRPLTGEETRKITESRIVLNKVIFARIGLVIVVNASNIVPGLTVEELKKIYTGTLQNWRELGGEERKIVAVYNDTGSLEWSAFCHVTMGQYPWFNIHHLHAVGRGAAVPVFVEVTAGAIGVESFFLATQFKNGLRPLKINGVEATRETIRSGTYPLIQDVCVYFRPETRSRAEELIRHLQTQKSLETIELMGLIPMTQ